MNFKTRIVVGMTALACVLILNGCESTKRAMHSANEKVQDVDAWVREVLW